MMTYNSSKFSKPTWELAKSDEYEKKILELLKQGKYLKIGDFRNKE